MKITHELKTHEEFFDEVWEGFKGFEIRLNDRDFKKDDILNLKEFNPKYRRYTGREIVVLVDYVLEGGIFGIHEDFVVMSIRTLRKHKPSIPDLA